jgi:hypothetical protein
MDSNKETARNNLIKMFRNSHDQKVMQALTELFNEANQSTKID